MRARTRKYSGFFFSFILILISILFFSLFILNQAVFKASILGLEPETSNMFLFCFSIISGMCSILSFMVTIFSLKRKGR